MHMFDLQNDGDVETKDKLPRCAIPLAQTSW